MSRVSGLVASLEMGQRVAARGSSWTIAGSEEGLDCHAVRLQPDTPGSGARDRTLLTPFDRLRPIQAVPAPRVVRKRRCLHELRRLQAESFPVHGFRAAIPQAVRLLPYQLEPALAVLRGDAVRLLIADSVGLGKTVETGLLLLELRQRTENFRALVLVPAGLREQWLQELDARLGLGCTLADSAWLVAASRRMPPEVNPWGLPGIYVASQDFVKRAEVLAPLEDVTWDVCVLDEAHLATARSDRRAAADAIARRARHVVLLTATPHPDAPAEFEALCRLGREDDGDPPILLFQRTRAELDQTGRRRTTILPVRPTLPERRMHELLDRYTRSIWVESIRRGDERARLASIVLRKRALSSAASLARSIRRRAALLAIGPAAPMQLGLPLADEDPLDDQEPDATLGVPGLSDARREHRWLRAIGEAADHASRQESKTRALIRLLNRVREPAIVFTEFRDTLAGLQRVIEAAGRPVVVLHGGMSPAERARVQRLFNAQPLTLLATDAASEGLNLHARCRLVIHYELPWSATRLEQRAGRVDRIGQEKRVHEIALVAADTAERLVLAPLLARSARAGRSGTGPAPFVESLTESRAALLILAAKPEPASTEHEGQSARTGAGLFVRLDLRREAELETERLEARRCAHERSPRMDRQPQSGVQLTGIRVRRSMLRKGWILVYRLLLSGRDNRPVALLYPVLELRTRSCSPVPRSARALRGLAAHLLRSRPDEANQRLQREILAAVEAAAPTYERLQRARCARDEAIFRLRDSTARRLVQAGLFDRRALKQIAAQEIRSRQWLDEREVRVRQTLRPSPLAIELELIAVLQIQVRRGCR